MYEVHKHIEFCLHWELFSLQNKLYIDQFECIINIQERWFDIINKLMLLDCTNYLPCIDILLFHQIRIYHLHCILYMYWHHHSICIQ